MLRGVRRNTHPKSSNTTWGEAEGGIPAQGVSVLLCSPRHCGQYLLYYTEGFLWIILEMSLISFKRFLHWLSWFLYNKFTIITWFVICLKDIIVLYKYFWHLLCFMRGNHCLTVILNNNLNKFCLSFVETCCHKATGSWIQGNMEYCKYYPEVGQITPWLWTNQISRFLAKV